MREIKFRAWDSERNKMIFTFDGEYEIMVNSEDGTIFCGGHLSNGDWNEPPLMQFTGLKDKEGQEIYEGDILSTKVFIDGKWEDSIEPVIFRDGCFALDWSFSKDGSYWEILTKEIEGKKILGNIYENSDLLEHSVKADA
jgi:uncharacterized phage protein (TIGR01671 family)